METPLCPCLALWVTFDSQPDCMPVLSPQLGLKCRAGASFALFQGILPSDGLELALKM